MGAIFGAFVMTLVFTLHKPNPTPDPAAEIAKAEESESKTPKPRFDFYKLLQESEQIVPATETIGDPEKASEAAASNIEYILQVALPQSNRSGQTSRPVNIAQLGRAHRVGGNPQRRNLAPRSRWAF